MAPFSFSTVSTSAPDGGSLTIILTPSSPRPDKPLHPATHLQLRWVFAEASGPLGRFEAWATGRAEQSSDVGRSMDKRPQGSLTR
ncbi:hypothetical protein HJFPF1_04939 [Paramyrothecium foliicola]|nr:hypothetical protein HJFPF1_04939 [Paramyrothecium foliicola]